MATTLRSVGGAVTVAAAMYWFDPATGRRRRALLVDQIGSVARKMRNAFQAGSRDLIQRLQGTAARIRSSFDSAAVDDVTLVARVRACLGRAVAHPGALEVSAMGGCVTLRGPILAEEYRRLMNAVGAVPGVRETVDQLDVYTDSTGIPSLQGGRSRPSPSLALIRQRWWPGTRLIAGVAGGAFILLAARNRNVPGMLGLVAGGALLVRSASNMPLAQWTGMARANTVQVHKTLRVNAPVDQVFQLLTRYEDFPLFMRNVRQVRVHPDGRSHWTVAGPAGTSLSWDAVVTRFEPNRLVEWRTASDTAVRHAGSIRFEPHNGGTRLEIRLSYSPPAGALGHMVARFLGADPKTALDEDLLRLKIFLESGKLPRDAIEQLPPRHFSTSRPDAVDGGHPLH